MAKQKTEASPGNESAPLKGVTKAAILLLNMDKEVAAAVLRHLDEEIVEDITREIAQLDMVGQDERGKVIGHDIEVQTRSVIENVKNILEEAGSSLDKVVDLASKHGRKFCSLHRGRECESSNGHADRSSH